MAFPPSDAAVAAPAGTAGSVAPTVVKIVVAGGFAVGKTTFIGSISDIKPLSTEAAMTSKSKIRHRRRRRRHQPQDHDDSSDGLRAYRAARQPAISICSGPLARTGSRSCGTTWYAARWVPSSWSTPPGSTPASQRSTTSGVAADPLRCQRSTVSTASPSTPSKKYGRALSIPADVPVIHTDARAREATKQALIAGRPPRDGASAQPVTRQVSPDGGRPLQGAGRRRRPTAVSHHGEVPDSSSVPPPPARGDDGGPVLPQPRRAPDDASAAELSAHLDLRRPDSAPPPDVTVPVSSASPVGRPGARPMVSTPRVYADGSALSRYLDGAPCRTQWLAWARGARGRAGHDPPRPDRAASDRPAARRGGERCRPRRRGPGGGRPVLRPDAAGRDEGVGRAAGIHRAPPRGRTRPPRCRGRRDVRRSARPGLGPARAHRRARPGGRRSGGSGPVEPAARLFRTAALRPSFSR